MAKTSVSTTALLAFFMLVRNFYAEHAVATSTITLNVEQLKKFHVEQVACEVIANEIGNLIDVETMVLKFKKQNKVAMGLTDDQASLDLTVLKADSLEKIIDKYDKCPDEIRKNFKEIYQEALMEFMDIAKTKDYSDFCKNFKEAEDKLRENVLDIVTTPQNIDIESLQVMVGAKKSGKPDIKELAKLDINGEIEKHKCQVSRVMNLDDQKHRSQLEIAIMSKEEYLAYNRSGDPVPEKESSKKVEVGTGKFEFDAKLEVQKQWFNPLVKANNPESKGLTYKGCLFLYSEYRTRLSLVLELSDDRII